MPPVLRFEITVGLDARVTRALYRQSYQRLEVTLSLGKTTAEIAETYGLTIPRVNAEMLDVIQRDVSIALEIGCNTFYVAWINVNQVLLSIQCTVEDTAEYVAKLQKLY